MGFVNADLIVSESGLVTADQILSELGVTADLILSVFGLLFFCGPDSVWAGPCRGPDFIRIRCGPDFIRAGSCHCTADLILFELGLVNADLVSFELGHTTADLISSELGLVHAGLMMLCYPSWVSSPQRRPDFI